MIALGNLLIALGYILNSLLYFLIIVIFVLAIISWVNPDPYNPVVRFLRATSEPFLKPVRRFVPLLGGGLDLSPLVLFLILMFLQIFLAQSLMDYGMVIKSNAYGSLRITGA